MDDTRPEPVRPSRAWALLALLTTATVPSIGTFSAMVAFPESTVAKVFFMGAKAWLLAAPLVWLKLIERRPVRMPRWSNRGMLAGHLTGAATFAIIIGVYLLLGEAWIDMGPMLEKIEQMSLDRWYMYAALAVYSTFINSLLEEYFWRWFIFRRLQDVLPRAGWATVAAVLGAAGLFTAHHIIALDAYFDWRVTALAATGVAIGGITWSVIYARYGNIYAAWISHIWADLALFLVGAWLVFG